MFGMNFADMANAMKKIEEYGAVFERLVQLVNELHSLSRAHCVSADETRRELAELREEIRQLREAK